MCVCVCLSLFPFHEDGLVHPGKMPQWRHTSPLLPTSLLRVSTTLRDELFLTSLRKGLATLSSITTSPCLAWLAPGTTSRERGRLMSVLPCPDTLHYTAPLPLHCTAQYSQQTGGCRCVLLVYEQFQQVFDSYTYTYTPM